MVNRIELPQQPQGSAEEQMRAMYSYLYQMAQALNNNLEEIGGAELTDGERVAMQEVLFAGAEEQAGAATEAETLKSLIIKTASFIRTAIDQYNLRLTGSAEAEGKIGKYVRNTQMDVDVTPEGIQQSFSFQEIIQGLKQYEINAKNYIKSGLLRTVDGIPVYGVAIGKDIVTFSQDGTETYNDGNKVAELTAEELSFWQNGAKVAGYKGTGINFAQDVTIASGKKLIIDTENFKINSAGQVTVKGGGEFSGELKAASGTFAGKLQAATGTFEGTMSAACITSGTMSANRISGGSIDANDVTINNLNASKITSGTMSANRISGGTLTLGGNNNANGTLIIKDASGTQIGKWDKDGISATKGSFSGELNSPSGNIGGLLIQDNALSADDFSIIPGAKTITAGDWWISPSGIRMDTSDADYEKMRLAIGEYYQIGATDWPQASITYLWNRGITKPFQSFRFTFQTQKISGNYSQDMLLMETVEDSDVKVRIRAIGWSSSGGGDSKGGQLGESTSNRWKYIYVDSINYLTMTQGSSRDIKHDIQDMPSMGARLDRLRPVTFVYDEDAEERTRYGLIYEETAETMPEICSGSEEEKAINYIELIPMLLKEIQELRGRVSELERRLGNVQGD